MKRDNAPPRFLAGGCVVFRDGRWHRSSMIRWARLRPAAGPWSLSMIPGFLSLALHLQHSSRSDWLRWLELATPHDNVSAQGEQDD